METISSLRVKRGRGESKSRGLNREIGRYQMDRLLCRGGMP